MTNHDTPPRPHATPRVRRDPAKRRDITRDITRGYDVSRGQYALFSKEDLLELEAAYETRGIEIVELVDVATVDPSRFVRSYWVNAAGRSSRGFSLLHAALVRAGRGAVCRVRLRSRTHLAILRPRGPLFSLDLLRFDEDLLGADDIDKPRDVEHTERELALAVSLVEQLAAFDSTSHVDERRRAMDRAIDEKIDADEIVTEPVRRRAAAVRIGHTRAIWCGEISFGLVAIPVRVYSASRPRRGARLHRVHRDCGTRVQIAHRCPCCARDLAFEEIARGVQVGQVAAAPEAPTNLVDLSHERALRERGGAA